MDANCRTEAVLRDTPTTRALRFSRFVVEGAGPFEIRGFRMGGDGEEQCEGDDEPRASVLHAGRRSMSCAGTVRPLLKDGVVNARRFAVMMSCLSLSIACADPPTFVLAEGTATETSENQPALTSDAPSPSAPGDADASPAPTTPAPPDAAVPAEDGGNGKGKGKGKGGGDD